MTRTTISRTLQAAVAAACMCAASASFAQWQWIDANGGRVYSDRPPPASVPASKILKRGDGKNHVLSPMTQVSAPAAETPLATPKQPAASEPKQLSPEQKKKQEEANAKAKEEADKQAKARAENCQRATTSKATLNSGMRVATTNAKGEREFMDDKARAAEMKRLDEIIASDCK